MIKLSRPHRVVLALLSAALMGGCSGPDAPESPDAAPIPEICIGDIAASDALTCAIASACAVYAPCYDGALSESACRQLAAADLGLFDLDHSYAAPLVASAMTAGTATYDSQELSRCLDAMSDLRCADIFASPQRPFGACEPFVGTVEPMGACVLDLECAGAGAYCDRTSCGDGDVCCPGLCATPQPDGGPCTRDVECGPEAYCVADTCADGSAGARCADDADCDSNNHCETGACVADRPSGASCERDAQCPAPDSCVGRTLPAGGLCARSLETGDPCVISCRSFPGHYCDQPDPEAPGTCRARVEEGTACTSRVMPCQIHMTCDQDSWTCRPAGDVGDSCSSSINCQFYRGLFCSTEIDASAPGLCQDRQTDGAACANDDHCRSGLCRQGACEPVAGCY